MLVSVPQPLLPQPPTNVIARGTIYIYIYVLINRLQAQIVGCLTDCKSMMIVVVGGVLARSSRNFCVSYHELCFVLQNSFGGFFFNQSFSLTYQKQEKKTTSIYES